jgi:hypothetical protein
MAFVEPTFSMRDIELLIDQEGVGQPVGSPPASSRASICESDWVTGHAGVLRVYLEHRSPAKSGDGYR